MRMDMNETVSPIICVTLFRQSMHRPIRMMENDTV